MFWQYFFYYYLCLTGNIFYDFYILLFRDLYSLLRPPIALPFFLYVAIMVVLQVDNLSVSVLILANFLVTKKLVCARRSTI